MSIWRKITDRSDLITFDPVPPAVNQPPVWDTQPGAVVLGIVGTAASWDFDDYISDPDADAMTATMNTGAAALGTGWTWTAATKVLAYDGSDNVGTTTGHIITISDGTDSVDSDTFGIETRAVTWPVNGWAMQGGYQISDGIKNMETEPYLTWNAEKDILYPQMFGASIASQLLAWTGRFKNVKAINPRIKILPYFEAGEIYLSAPASWDVNWKAWNYRLVNNGTKGNTQWYLKDSDGNNVVHHFSPSDNNRDVNSFCTQFQDNNSLSRNYAEQYIEDLYDNYNTTNANGTILEYTDGLFMDVCSPMKQRVYVDGSGGSTEDNVDFNNNSSADTRNNENDGSDVEANYGGARMHRRGIVNGSRSWVEAFKTKFGSSSAFTANGSEDAIKYQALNLAKPWDDSEFVEKFDSNILELADQSFGIKKAGSGYNVNWDGFSQFMEASVLCKQRVVDSTNIWGPFGRHCIVIDVGVIDRGSGTFNAIDYDFMRWVGGLCALTGTCLGTNVNTTTPTPPLDEFVYAWGSPTDPAHPNPGTLDTASTNNPWTLRTADFTSGAASFWWVEFDNVLWVVRGDYPSTGTAKFGTGSAVNCELPNPGVGKKWIHPDLSAYTNTSSGFSTRDQNSTLNSGSDVTSGGTYGVVSLLPAHAVMVQRDTA